MAAGPSARPPAPPDDPQRAVRRALLPWLAACVLGPPSLAVLGQAAASAASVKAAYLYKMLAYVDWPPSAFIHDDAPQVIGVLADDAVLGELLQIVAGRRVQGRTVVARRVNPGDSVDDLHVLFVGRGASANLLGWLPGLRGRPAVLVVTDTPAGLSDYSVLNFVLVEGHVRFEASLAAAERSGLKLSARLLAVAERVVPP